MLIIVLILCSLQCEFVIQRQEEARQLRHIIVTNTLVDLGFSEDATSETEQNEMQKEAVKVKQRCNQTVVSKQQRDVRESETVIKQPSPTPIHANAARTLDSVSSRDVDVTPRGAVMTSRETVVPSREPVVLSREPMVPSRETVVPSREPVVTSRETVVPSRETVVPSREPVVPSRGAVVTSREPVVTSRGAVVTSRGAVMTSSYDTITSRDVSILMLQSLLRGFKARLRYRNTVEQARQEVYKEYQEMLSAARVIQRVWRGYSIRLITLIF